MGRLFSLAVWVLLLPALALVLRSRGQVDSRASAATVVPDAGPSGPTAEHVAAGPLALIENRGQWDLPAAFVGELAGHVVRLEPGALVVHTAPGASGGTGALLRLEVEGARTEATIHGEGERPGRYAFFLGNDPEAWRSGLRAYRAARYRGLLEGLDLVVREQSGRLKYDLELAPSVDAATLSFRWAGADGLTLRADGALVIDTPAGELVQPPAETFELDHDGVRRPLACTYRLLGADRFGFAVAQRTPGLPLVIDPELAWASYLGAGPGFNGDIAFDIDVADDGTPTVTGRSDWHDFPTTPGAFVQGPPQNQNVFVTRFDATGCCLVYSCIVGGTTEDRAHAVAVDGAGRATVVGWTGATDFPITPGAFSKTPAFKEGFVFRLSPEGDALEYSTFLGGAEADEPNTVALAPSGAAIVGGWTTSADFPVTPGAFQSSPLVPQNGFVTRLDPSGSHIEWSTFLGGKSTDIVRDLCLDEAEHVTITGETASNDFPTTPGAVQPVWFGSIAHLKAFVTRLSADGRTLIWSTYLGGIATVGHDLGLAVAVDPYGHVAVAGFTAKGDFPTTPGAFQTKTGGSPDAFVARIDSTGSALLYSTHFGGVFGDSAVGAEVDASGIVTFSGFAGLVPTTPGSYNPTERAPTYVARLDPSGSRLFYSTYLGGKQIEAPTSMAMTPTGRVVVTGYTTGGFPTTPHAFDPYYNGGQTDAFVAALDLVLEGVRIHGASTPACHGALLMNVTEMPVAGSPSFALTCSGAPPNARGLLLVGTPAAAERTVLGAGVWLALGRPWARMAVTSGVQGYAETAIPLPPAGSQLAAQYLFENTSACGGPGAWSASNAVVLTVQ